MGKEIEFLSGKGYTEPDQAEGYILKVDEMANLMNEFAEHQNKELHDKYIDKSATIFNSNPKGMKAKEINRMLEENQIDDSEGCQYAIEALIKLESQFEKCKTATWDFQSEENHDLQSKNKELIEANKILYNCWINLHTIRYNEAKPEDKWYAEIEEMAKEALKTNKK